MQSFPGQTGHPRLSLTRALPVTPQPTPVQRASVVLNPYENVVDPLLTNEESHIMRVANAWREAGSSSSILISSTQQIQPCSELKIQGVREQEKKSRDENEKAAFWDDETIQSNDAPQPMWDESVYDDITPKLAQWPKLSASWRLARRKRQEGCRLLYNSDAASRSPLHYATGMDKVIIVKRLIQTDNPNQYHPETGETPLHLACRLGRLAIVKTLRRHPQIQINLPTLVGTRIPCKPGVIALDLAKEKGFWEIVKFLVNYKMKKDKRPPTQTAKDVEYNRPDRAIIESMQKENKKMRLELKKLKSQYSSLNEENDHLNKQLSDLMDQDLEVMGIKLPRAKPKDCRKIAEVLPRLRELEQELTTLQEQLWSKLEVEKLCSVCKYRPRGVVIIPCGHFLCNECAEADSTCPSCQVEIGKRIKTQT